MTDTVTTNVNVPETWPADLGPLELRSGGPVGAVSFPKRTITLVAVPYDVDAEVVEPSRSYLERFARGAFAGVQNRTGRIKVNRDHDVRRPVGKALALHPTRTEGLVAELRISATALGDETLALADDGVLDSSVGFGVKPADVEWSNGKRNRTIVRAFLDHIALTASPIYETASVLEVRHGPDVGGPAPSPTPLLDEILAARRLAEYAHLT
jgi:HK97 family phage prohead protease